MKQSGRVNLLLLGAIVCIAVLGFVFLSGRESVTTVGSRFMSALAKGDVDTLTKMSYIDGESPDHIRKEWDFAVNEVAKHYRFTWRITSARETGKESAAVSMQVARNADSGGAYEEKFELPLQKVDGDWKVDVTNISRDMYPGLPRGSKSSQ
jgi:hypothetical protein